MLSILYAVESWALLTLGGLHMAATVNRFNTVSSDALWFFSAGVLIAVVGAVNLLNRTYGPAAPGLRRVCVAVNIVNLGLTIAGGAVTGADVAQWIIVLAIVIPLTLLSALPPRVRAKAQAGAA